jgi:hypothetical protein
MSSLLGIRYNLEKKEASGFEDRDLSGDQNEHRKKTSERIDKETSVLPTSIRRDPQSTSRASLALCF